MSFLLESFLSMHLLFAISSLCIGGNWFLRQPSLKLRIARLLFLSCLVSPLAVRFVKKEERPFLAHYISLDDSAEKSRIVSAPDALAPIPIQTPSSKQNFDYKFLIFIFFLLGILYQVQRLFKDLRKLKSLLISAVSYKSFGKIQIKVSDRCHIPFSTRSFPRAYIVLPVSMLNSSTNMKLAIAHEGQHHRQGDCVWAYFMECVRIVFFGNPGVRRWHRILSELQELSCDEVLVGHQMVSAHDYGHCLYKVAQTVSEYSKPSHREFACTVGMAWKSGNNEGSFIRRRICMLSQYHLSKRSLWSVVLTGIAIGMPLCAAYAAKGTFSLVADKKIDISSVDSRIQKIASAEITAAVKRYRAKSGAIAVADPRTGKIIAFAESGSSTDSDSWSSRIFAPASTLKPYIAAAAIEEDLASESQVYNCRDPYTVGGEVFRNHDSHFTDVSLSDAIAHSVNVCIVKLALDLGSANFREKLAEFGFDTSSQWRSDRSDALQLAHAALGKNIPLNIGTLTKAYALLANKGHLFAPSSGSVISESTAEAVTRMLVKVVENGTGKRAALSGVRVAGKTGTSGDEQGSLALFAGYLPAEAPRFVSVVVIEDGSDANGVNSGGALAAPVFSKVAAESLNLLTN